MTPSAGPNSNSGQGQISPISLQLPARDPNNGVVEIFESMCKFPVAAEDCRMYKELRRTNNMNFVTFYHTFQKLEKVYDEHFTPS